MNPILKNAIVVVFYFLLLYLVFLAIDNIVLPSITSGSATITIPKLVGNSLSDAERKIKQAGLSMEITKEVNSEKVPAGAVVTQIPAPSSVVKAGRCIYVTVSKGAEMVDMPYVKGLNMRNVRMSLLKAGLELGKTSYEFNENYGKDTIAWQSVSAGSKVAYGAFIDVVVSKGSEAQTKIPNLINLTYLEATTMLTESGLSIGDITYKVDKTYIPDLVVGQTPAAGEIVTPETKISLVLTK